MSTSTAACSPHRLQNEGAYGRYQCGRPQISAICTALVGPQFLYKRGFIGVSFSATGYLAGRLPMRNARAVELSEFEAHHAVSPVLSHFGPRDVISASATNGHAVSVGK